MVPRDAAGRGKIGGGTNTISGQRGLRASRKGHCGAAATRNRHNPAGVKASHIKGAVCIQGEAFRVVDAGAAVRRNTSRGCLPKNVVCVAVGHVGVSRRVDGSARGKGVATRERAHGCARAVDLPYPLILKVHDNDETRIGGDCNALRCIELRVCTDSVVVSVDACARKRGKSGHCRGGRATVQVGTARVVHDTRVVYRNAHRGRADHRKRAHRGGGGVDHTDAPRIGNEKPPRGVNRDVHRVVRRGDVKASGGAYAVYRAGNGGIPRKCCNVVSNRGGRFRTIEAGDGARIAA